MNAGSRQPSLRQLEYFVMVARSGNFRRAAERLAVTQPTLTSQIAALEESLDTRLFERSRAGTLLSPAGRELLPLARAVLDHYQTFLEFSGNRQQEVSGLFQVGVASTAGPWLLSAILSDLRDLYPRLLLSFREDSPESLEAGLAAGDHDFILTLLPLNSVDNQVRPLFSESFDAIFPPDHLPGERPRLEASDLEGQMLLGVEDNHLQRQLLGLCEASGAQMQPEHRGNSLGTLQQMVMMGLGMAVLPSLYVRHEISSTHNLVIKPLPRALLQRTHVAAWRRNAPSRQLFRKLSWDLKTIGLARLGPMLEDVVGDED